MPGQSPFQQITDAYRSRIISGDLKEGDRLPSVRALADEWGVAHATAAKVWPALAKEGIVAIGQRGCVALTCTPDRQIQESVHTSSRTYPELVPGPARSRDPIATESELLDLLEQALTKPDGTGAYAFMRQVRNAAGGDATRVFDAVAVGLWPSRGHEIHVYEVKVDRSDWMRELGMPEKAEDAARLADRFTVVAPRDVVQLAEVPATWGLIHAVGGTAVMGEGGRRIEGRGLRTVRPAPLLRPAEECRGPVPRSFLVPLLRAASAGR